MYLHSMYKEKKFQNLNITKSLQSERKVEKRLSEKKVRKYSLPAHFIFHLSQFVLHFCKVSCALRSEKPSVKNF